MLGKRTRSSFRSKGAKRGRHLSKTAKEDVKKIVRARQAYSLCHNGPIPGPSVVGVLAGPPTSILAFTATNQGLNEYNRRGDSIWIDQIKFRCYVNTVASNDAIRLTVLRQPRSGFPPSIINLNAVWQNNTSGAEGLVSAFQDDQPCQVLYDKVYTLGIAAGLQECRYIEFTLNYAKRPLRCVYQDNSPIGTTANTVLGDIELVATSNGVGTVTMRYTYDLKFHEK